jgi:hypothetical protein
VFPITALTKEFIGCIVEITPVVSVAKALILENTNNIIIDNNFIISRPLKFVL